MKNSIIITIIAFVIALQSCSPDKKLSDHQLLTQLDSLYDADSYFKFMSVLELNKQKLEEKDLLYYSALSNFVFNNQSASIHDIDLLLSKYKQEINDTLLTKIYRAKRMSHINSYEYAKAVEASKILIDHFKHIEDSADYAELLNEHKIWIALSKSPKQEISIKRDCVIPMKRDKVGLMNVITNIGSDTVNFLFDTGANFSVMTRSVAHKHDIEIIEADFYVTAATGNRVACDLAVVKEIQIADIMVYNSVFLVMEDEDLSFPQIDYYPNGAIGFPIIEAMEELRFDRDGKIFVPATPTTYSFNNLALDGLMPVLAVNYNDDTLQFNFDTGASHTSFYSPFYLKYQEDIDQKYPRQTFSAGSGGGSKEFEGFIIDSIQLGVANSKASLVNTRLHQSPLTHQEETIHGNFGQDYIKQFEEMIISFKYSSVVFK